MEAKGKFQISLDSAFYLLKHFDGITIEELQELEKAGKLIRSISTALSKIKNGDPINFDQISARVTPSVEKSNFYKDLNTLIDSEFTTKKSLEKKM
jgi:hypothetical protein